MRFMIQHQTLYTYSHAVKLGSQLLRFYPRVDSNQSVVNHQVNINPPPAGSNDYLDMEGNRTHQAWFDGKTHQLDIQVNMVVDTYHQDSLNFLLSPEALSLPIRHNQDHAYVAAYLKRIEIDDSVTAYAAELSMTVNRNTLDFLNRLNHLLYSDYQHIHRDTGSPQTPAFTLQARQGACRDLALLFVDCCRAEGIAARFVSGYQKGDIQSERRHLHAWPEVYLPGAGWRGYDPTHGDSVADTHVTIAAAAHPQDTMPVTGSFDAIGAKSTLDYEINIQVL